MAHVESTIPVVREREVRLLRDISNRTKRDVTQRVLARYHTTPATCNTERFRIFRTELRVTWNEYRRFREAVTYEKATHQEGAGYTLLQDTGRFALKSCTLARAAFVLGGMANGLSLDTANTAASDVAAAYIKSLSSEEVKLPAYRLLSLPVEDAVRAYKQDSEAYGKIRSTMEAMLGLSAVALAELNMKKGEFYVLPTVE